MWLTAALGGALIVYGVHMRAKTRPQNPDSTNELLRLIHEPDPLARQEGNLALGIGLFMLVGSAFL